MDGAFPNEPGRMLDGAGRGPRPGAGAGAGGRGFRGTAENAKVSDDAGQPQPPKQPGPQSAPVLLDCFNMTRSSCSGTADKAVHALDVWGLPLWGSLQLCPRGARAEVAASTQR